MEIQDLKPRKGDDTYRIGDSDDLVLMENVGAVPSGGVCLQNHGIIFFCTEGRAQFEYDGNVVQIQKNDMFLYMVHSTMCNFLTSPDFNCRQIWFTRSELWNIEIYNLISVADMSLLKLHPVVHLNDDDIKLCDTYFQLLCSRIKSSSALTSYIVRSLLGTIMLEILSIMRRNSERAVEENQQEELNPNLFDAPVFDDSFEVFLGQRQCAADSHATVQTVDHGLEHLVLEDQVPMHQDNIIIFQLLLSAIDAINVVGLVVNWVVNEGNLERKMQEMAIID